MKYNKMRIILAKMGLDGHDKGLKLIANRLQSLGEEVIYLGLRQSADNIVQSAIQEDADVIGISILSGSHISLAEKLLSTMKKNNVHFRIIFGGTIPLQDIATLKKIGISDALPVGTSIEEVLKTFRNERSVNSQVSCSEFPEQEGQHVDRIRNCQNFKTASGIQVKDIFTKEDVSFLDENEEIGLPGKYPFTRGPYETMYRGRIWTMRQYAGLGTAVESNQRFKYLLDQGQTGLSVALDLPTQLGYDSDNTDITEEVGRVGVAIDTVEDMYTLFQDIPLDKISVNFTINSTAIVILAMYMVMAEEKGYNTKTLSGTVQNDMIKEFLSRNTFIFPLMPSIKLATDIIHFCSFSLPKFNPISCSGYHIRELGANAIQELATTLSAGIIYTEEALKRGLPIDEFAPRLSFQLSCYQDIFEEIAKFRVARKMWAKIMKNRFQAKKEKSLKFRVFSGGNGSSLTAQEPLNNIVRGAFQCLAGALGGAQAIHVPAYDEAYTIPTEESALLSLRTQQITAYETGITNTVDPLAGSYYLESLTNELEDRANQLMEEINRMGGLLKCIENGWIINEVIKNAYQTQMDIETKKKIIVGVNRYASESSTGREIKSEQLSANIAENQGSRLEKVKKERDVIKVKTKLSILQKAANQNENLFPSIVDAVRDRATIGEIINTLKKIYGEYKGI
ncbi:MAG: methylmalonyl-CoA mutase family protein [Bacteroidales bacterium]|jgi:methylmalonyl-CoA mutase N-terminal domain/subunit|nr:methylmalonyl-CoA mutase family protein [Bacteroidales bacterium]